MFKDLLADYGVPEDLSGQARADLVVYEKVPLEPKGYHLKPRYVIEVKRASAQDSKIDDDLRRLMLVKSVLPEVGAYLVVISEAERPVRFVSEEGTSVRAVGDVSGGNGYFKVRRTWKASYRFTNTDRANYACLIEAYASG